MRRLLTLAVVLAATASMVPAHASTRTVTKSYVGHFDPLTIGFCDHSLLGNVGKVCFPVVAGERKVTITSNDTVTGKAAFFYIVRDASGGCIGQPADPTAACPSSDFGCGSAKVILPSNSAMVDVFTGGILNMFACSVLLGADDFAPATAGTFTAVFSTTL